MKILIRPFSTGLNGEALFLLDLNEATVVLLRELLAEARDLAKRQPSLQSVKFYFPSCPLFATDYLERWRISKENERDLQANGWCEWPGFPGYEPLPEFASQQTDPGLYVTSTGFFFGMTTPWYKRGEAVSCMVEAEILNYALNKT